MCCNNITEKDLQPGTNFPVMLDKIKGMKFFDPHVHMTSRTTDDYQAMADAGIVALIEPAFWLGQPPYRCCHFQGLLQQPHWMGTFPRLSIWYQTLLHHWP